MSSKNQGSGGCGCGGTNGITAIGGTSAARTGYHARARAAGKAAAAGGDCGCGGSGGGSCGCGGGSGGGSCGCGGSSGGGSCGCNAGVLVKPTFFAGQLLTDDDLQALTNYMVTRQRLHNRFLVGSGVACGLAVTCHPCGGGRVIVQPGYAVDCCGNEILVPCAVELDINAMVRALKTSMRGQDCGDPCAEPIKDRSPQSRAAALPNPAAAVAVLPGTNQPAPLAGSDDDPHERGKRYCLYINYCEEPTDLVAPYTQDDSCSVTCQPSRLREGFSFELRCPAEEPEPPSFVDRLRCCIGDLQEADGKSAAIERSQLYAKRNQIGLAAYKAELAPQFDDDDANLVTNANAKLETVAEEFFKVRRSSKSAAVGSALLDEQALRTALDELHAVGAATARYHLMSGEAREKVQKKFPQIEKALAANREMLVKFSPALEEQVNKTLSTPLERTTARSVIGESLKYSDPQLTESERKTAQAYVYAYNGVATAAANKDAHQALADFKAWLLRKIDECPPTGQCCLEAEIGAIHIPTGEETTEETYRALEKLARAFIRYLLDCICSALLPPCPTCDDPAVKLACITLDECKVCEICNLERTFLLTEHNLRYWIPLLHTFGEALEKLCCEFANRFKLRSHAPDYQRENLPMQHVELKKQTAFFKSGTQIGTLAASSELFPNLVRFTGLELDDVESSLNLGGNFARMTARDPVITSIAARFTDVDATKVAGQKALAAAFERSPASDLVRSEVGLVAERVEKKVDAHFKDVADELDKRLSPNVLAQAKVIKDLQQQLDEQHDRNEKLAVRILNLEKRKTP